jgi:DNA-binding response OmpR family regulator
LKALNVLLVEDNAQIARQITTFLEGLKWQVDYADRGEVAVSLACDNIFDVVILDLNLPDIDGTVVCRKIKQNASNNAPVLMLTARDAYEDKALGFSAGADDYLTKPFDMRELALRCDVLARRPVQQNSRQLKVGRLTVDLNDHSATVEDTPLKITKTGFDILLSVVRSYPQAISKSLLMHQIWGNSPPASNALKSHIYSLRKALEGAFGHNVLLTVNNIGYKLVQLDNDDNTDES